MPRHLRCNSPSRFIASASSRWARGGRGAGARRGRSQRPAKVFTRPLKPAPAARMMRARKGGCVRWFFIIWVNQVGFGKSFAARRGRFWLASATGYRPIRRAGERLVLVPDKLLARAFCRALRAGFAGLGCLGFLVAKQPLPKRGLRLGQVGRPGFVAVPSSRVGPEGSSWGEGGGRGNGRWQGF